MCSLNTDENVCARIYSGGQREDEAKFAAAAAVAGVAAAAAAGDAYVKDKVWKNSQIY